MKLIYAGLLVGFYTDAFKGSGSLDAFEGNGSLDAFKGNGLIYRNKAKNNDFI